MLSSHETLVGACGKGVRGKVRGKMARATMISLSLPPLPDTTPFMTQLNHVTFGLEVQTRFATTLSPGAATL